MKLPLFWVDAFTTKIFHGNPAGVVPLAAWPEPALMQRIAFENGLAETAFFVRTGPCRFHLRWFTPELEMDLCGHATLASAFVVFTRLGETGDRIVFDSRSGPLTVTRFSDGRLELDFPSRPPAAVPAAQLPPTLVPGLGGPAPDWIGKARDYLCVYPTAEAVLSLRPDFTALNRIDVIGIIATGPGRDGVDFVSRFFCPNCGVPEDPVHRLITLHANSLLGAAARQIDPARPASFRPRRRIVLRVARRPGRHRRPRRPLFARRDRSLSQRRRRGDQRGREDRGFSNARANRSTAAMIAPGLLAAKPSNNWFRTGSSK